MKRAKLILLIIIIISISSSGIFAKQNNLAIIDFIRVRQETSIGKRMTWEIENEKKKQEDAFTSKRREIVSLEKQLRKGDDTLSEIQRLNLKQQLEKLQLKLKEKYEKTMIEIQKSQENFVKEYSQRIMPVLHKFSKEKNYSAILSSVSVVWAEPSLNVTDEFIKRVNSEIK